MKSRFGAVGIAMLATFLLIACSLKICAQTVNLTDDVARPIPGSGHDYIHLVNETVSPANGSVNIKIDLPTPKGRGLTLPFAITYNSGEVNNFASFSAGGGYLESPGTSEPFTPTDRSDATGGWSDSYPYVSATGYSIVGYVVSSGVQIAIGSCPITTSYNFYDPNGGSHELGLQAIGSMQGDTTNLGFGQFSCNPDGNPGGAGPLAQLQNLGLDGFQSGGDDEVSAQMDNDCVGYPSGTQQDCSLASPAFTVTDEHGTVYSFPAYSATAGTGGQSAITNIIYPTQIEDRNGNIITLSAGNPYLVSGSTPVVAVDTLGNALISETVSGNRVTSYTVGGLTYTLQWTTLSNIGYSLPNWQIPIEAGVGVNGCGALFSLSNASYPVVQSITLPNGQQYTFQYDPVYGRISQINYPDGGWVHYTWGPSDTYSTVATFDGLIGGSPMSNLCNFQYSTPVVTQRTVGYSAGSGPAQTQTFHYYTYWAATQGNGSSSYYWNTKYTFVTATDNVRNLSSETVYSYLPVFEPNNPPSNGSAPPQLPVESSIAYYDWGNTAAPPAFPSAPLIETVNKTWADQFRMTSEQNVQNNGQSSRSCYPTWAGDLPTEKDEFDYTGGLCGSGSQSRTTLYGYCMGDPSQVSIYNGTSSGVLVAQTTAAYGSQTTAASTPAGTHDETNYGPGSTKNRCNATQVSKWNNAGAPSITTLTYDETGQVLSMTDPRGNLTQYSYTDIPCPGCAANPAGNSNAYLTKITNPLGQTQQFGYSYVTTSNYLGGELGSATDENSHTTTYKYADSLYRLTQTNYPDGGETTVSYNDSVPSVTTSTLLNASNQWETNVAIIDGLGHVTQAQLTTDPDGVDYVDTTYDGESRVRTKSNPHRSSPQPTDGISTFDYDALGRPIETQEQDGSLLQWCYNGKPSLPAVSSGVCSSAVRGTPSTTPGSITGTWVDSTDELGNHWQRSLDAFGRLTQVMEPSGSSQSPSMETDYNYDALNNLLSVNQWGGAKGSPGARMRSFLYNSLSQLTWASNPETGTVSYAYDLNGNVQSKADARSITTTYTYDALNRLLSKTYSDGITPASCYQYDSSSATSATCPSNPNWVGRLTNAWTLSTPSGASCPAATPFLTKRSITCYDPMGRLLSELQFTPANHASGYAPAYTYDLAGNLLTSTSGVAPNPTPTTAQRAFAYDGVIPIQLNYSYDGAGRLQTAGSNVSSNWINGTALPPTLFGLPPTQNTSCTSQTGQYAAFGGLMNASFGSTNTPAFTLNRAYDSRLRTTCESDKGAGTTPATPGSATVTITGAERTH